MTTCYARSPTAGQRDSASSSPTASNTILGAHVLGEYSAEIVQVVVACMTAGMTVEQIAELHFAFPTFTEGVSMAAQKICRTSGSAAFPRCGAISAPKTDGYPGPGSMKLTPSAQFARPLGEPRGARCSLIPDRL